MCKDAARHAILATLPKCEHHVHIEGTLTPEVLFSLCKRNNITLPTSDPAFATKDALLERYNHFTSLDDFLHYYYIAMSALVTAQDFEDLAYAYFETAAADGVVHAEISFDPQAHLERGVAFATIIEGLMRARRRAEKDFGTSTQMICCFLRHLPAASALELIQHEEFQAAVSAGSIVGIGLDSSETNFPPEMFEEVFKRAKALSLRLTAHAGEEGAAENIETALNLLGCERIDHGVRLADRADLVRKVAESGILLTVCPMSNLQLRCVKDIAELPIRLFLDAGVKFSVNSDDPAYFGGFVLANYCALQDAFGLEMRDWETICANAIDGSWCSVGRKMELRERLRSCLRM